MKIHAVEITNYKAFLGKHMLKVRGKNVFIYGENGSGKSSLYYALKDLFQSSIEDIDFSPLENIFTAEAKRGSGKVKVTLKPDGGRRNSEKPTMQQRPATTTVKRLTPSFAMPTS